MNGDIDAKNEGMIWCRMMIVAKSLAEDIRIYVLQKEFDNERKHYALCMKYDILSKHKQVDGVMF